MPKNIRIKLKKDALKLDDFELLNKIFQYDYKKNYNDLNESQKALHNWFIISGDVGNGGFIQYFENTKGEFNEGGLKALKLIGDKKMYKVLSDAIKIFNKNIKHFILVPYEGPIKEPEGSLLEKLDSKFFKQDEKTDKILAKYVRKNINNFAIIQ